MRVAPTAVNHEGTANKYQILQGGAVITCSSVPFFQGRTTNDSWCVLFTVPSGLTAGYAGVGQTDTTDGASAYLEWSAEL